MCSSVIVPSYSGFHLIKAAVKIPSLSLITLYVIHNKLGKCVS